MRAFPRRRAHDNTAYAACRAQAPENHGFCVEINNVIVICTHIAIRWIMSGGAPRPSPRGRGMPVDAVGSCGAPVIQLYDGSFFNFMNIVFLF